MPRHYLQANPAPNPGLVRPSGPDELVHSDDSSNLHPTYPTCAEPATFDGRRTMTSFASLNPPTTDSFMSSSFVYVPSTSTLNSEPRMSGFRTNGSSSSALLDHQPQRSYRGSLPAAVDSDVAVVSSPHLPQYPLRLSTGAAAGASISAAELLAGGGRAPNTFRRMMSDASPQEFRSAVDDPALLSCATGDGEGEGDGDCPPLAATRFAASTQVPACALENGSSLSRQAPNVQYEREFLSLPRSKQQPPPDQGPWSPMQRVLTNYSFWI